MKFKRGDGGCALYGDQDKACDVEYISENGTTFRVYTSPIGFQFLPAEFETADIGERNNRVVELTETLSPSFVDARGISPNACDGKSPEDFIRHIRDTEWD